MFAKNRSLSKCGEETSPTPQMDWSLAHGLKTAFGLNLLFRIFPRFCETARFRRISLAAAIVLIVRQLLCHN